MIRRQLTLFDKDESGVVDYKEFKLAIRKYMNGVEEEDMYICSNVIGIIENVRCRRIRIAIEGSWSHNCSYKEYDKSKPKQSNYTK